MFRNWWRSLGFYWQVYLIMVASFGGVIVFVEGVAEPFVLRLLAERFEFDVETSETILWIVSVLLPTLLLGFVITHMVVRKMITMVAMAKRLGCGDFAARIETPGNEKDVFNQLSGVFNNMADSLERLLAHEKRLMADVSHELRSPLTRMGIATALLPMKQQTGELDAVIKVLEDELTQMNTLVSMLLERGRERLKNQSDFSLVPLSELVTEAVAAHTLVAESDGKHIAAEVVPETAVWGHPVRVRMILENILSNALFYAPPGSSIEVRVFESDELVFLSVRDHGPGVPEKHVQDIFRAFFRVDRSRARTSGGVGLGLALARDAAVAMGGGIEAKNVHPGLEVTVTLPRPGHSQD